MLLAVLVAARLPLVAQVRVPPVLSASASGQTVTVSWTTAEVGIEQFVLEVGSRPGASDLTTLSFSSGTRTLTAPGVAAGTYYLRLFSIVAGARGPASNVVEVVVGTPSCVNPPEPPRTLISNVSGQQIVLSWTEPFDAGAGCPVSGYVLEAGTASGASNLAALYLPVQLSFNAVVPPGTYFVRLRAWNAAGLSRASNEVQIVIGLGPRALSMQRANWRPAAGGLFGSVVAILRNDGGEVATDVVASVRVTRRVLVANPTPGLPPIERWDPVGEFQAQITGRRYHRPGDGRVFHNAIGPGDVACLSAPDYVREPLNNNDLGFDLSVTSTSRQGLVPLSSLVRVFDVRSSRDALGNWLFSGSVRNEGSDFFSESVAVMPFEGGLPAACLNGRMQGVASIYPGETARWQVNGGALGNVGEVWTWAP